MDSCYSKAEEVLRRLIGKLYVDDNRPITSGDLKRILEELAEELHVEEMNRP